MHERYALGFFFFKQKTAYEMRISDWSSDVCSSDLLFRQRRQSMAAEAAGPNPASALADQAYAAQLQVRIALAVEEPTPSVERLAHFWANHFAVSADSQVFRALPGALEPEAIRPPVLGRSPALLLAVRKGVVWGRRVSHRLDPGG